MNRRQFLTAAATAPALLARSSISRSRISAITDEIGRTPAASIEFAQTYGLQWVELRAVPGARQYYSEMEEAEVRAAAREFAAAGLKVSFLNSGLLKFQLPGTQAARVRPETAEARQKREAREAILFERRMDHLRIAIRNARILGTDKVRVFAFARVADPAALMPRIHDLLGEMVQVAEKEGVRLLMENEASCNIATCAELAASMKAIPSKAYGINWDPLNGTRFQEKPFPDGYHLLPKKRLGNVQIKGRSILPGPEVMDWAAIFDALSRDGYPEQVGLETHIFGEEQVARSHDSMREILRIVES